VNAEREAFGHNLPSRHRIGSFWRFVFQASTIIGIVALTALLYNIIDGAFGYVAVENKVDPGALVLAVHEERLLAAPNLIASADAEQVAAGVAASRYAIGLIDFVYYQGHDAELRALAVDGVTPTDDTVASGDYPLSGPSNEEPLGTTAVAVVVAAQNGFLTRVSTEQLRGIFAAAETWADVNPDLPRETVERFIPAEDSAIVGLFVETVFHEELAELPKAELLTVLQTNISAGLFRRLEADKPFAERTQQEVLELVLERVIEPQVVQTWSLHDSLLNRSSVLAEAAQKYPTGEVRFSSWIKPSFVVSPQSSDPQKAGVRTAILGSLWTIAITMVVAFPLGVGAAIYLQEYASDSAVNRIIQTNINNLAGVPSIIYGMLGLAIFVRALEPLTSGTLFGLVDPTTANGRTVLSAGLTLGLLILPLIIINAQEAIKAVPNSLRQASYGVGATKWQTVWSHVLPNAISGILTGTILAISRAIGETAPLVVVGASTFITVDPAGPFSKFTTLPIQVYQWTSRPQGEFRNIAAAAILVLLALLLSLNASAVMLRNRYSRRW
jgi:phosphate transport system permease protein